MSGVPRCLDLVLVCSKNRYSETLAKHPVRDSDSVVFCKLIHRLKR